MIVLSSDQAVKDLLDKRSGIYSSRPSMYLGGEVGSGGLRMVLMVSKRCLPESFHDSPCSEYDKLMALQEYGEKWRNIRKLMHAALTINVAKSYVPYQNLESKQLLRGILDQPELVTDHIERYTNSLSTQMFFGFRTISIDDPKLKKLYAGMAAWSQLVASRMSAVIDLYPITRNLPGHLLPQRRHAEGVFANTLDLYRGHWLNAKQADENGTLKVSVFRGHWPDRLT